MVVRLLSSDLHRLICFTTGQNLRKTFIQTAKAATRKPMLRFLSNEPLIHHHGEIRCPYTKRVRTRRQTNGEILLTACLRLSNHNIQLPGHWVVIINMLQAAVVDFKRSGGFRLL